MINVLIFLILAIALLVNTIIMLQWGIRIGKAMQKDVPENPMQPVVNAVKKGFKLVRDREKKSYLQKKGDKKEFNIWDY